MLKANAVLKFNHLPKYADSGKRVQRVLMEAGFDVEAKTKQNIVAQDLIETGAMHNDPSVSTPDDSTVRIGFSLGYPIWHEIGTIHHPARPTITPAFDEVKDTIPSRMRREFG